MGGGFSDEGSDSSGRYHSAHAALGTTLWCSCSVHTDYCKLLGTSKLGLHRNSKPCWTLGWVNNRWIPAALRQAASSSSNPCGTAAREHCGAEQRGQATGAPAPQLCVTNGPFLFTKVYSAQPGYEPFDTWTRFGMFEMPRMPTASSFSKRPASFPRLCCR